MIHQRELVPRKYVLDGVDFLETTLNLVSSGEGPKARFTFEAIRPNLFRTTFSSPEHPLPPHPSAALPESSLGNESVPKWVHRDEKARQINLGDVVADVEWTVTPVVSLYLKGELDPIHQDLKFRSYALDSTGTAHYTVYKRNTLHMGLGEKAAPMNLSNRHFILSATDCFGYDVYRTDPLYKHIPLLINATPRGCFAIFSTSHSRGTWSIGSEIDGLWGHYKVYRQAHGGLEEYLIVGRNLKDIVKTYADLVGYPKLVPRWALGYIAGGMKYSMLDEPRACDAILEFAKKLERHDIPCSAFQMSSGYTVAETEPKTRNVFTWNRHRFPDPRVFTKACHAAGIRLIANVKPYVLASHPEYARLARERAFFTNPNTKNSAVARLWSAGGGESSEGGHIDFTSKAGFDWWFDGVQALRNVGIDSIWNDNNEYVISDDGWQLALENNSSASRGHSASPNNVGLWGRAMQTELMAKASHGALVAFDPEIRPFVLTRSATAGTMRYAASSWSGDNVTSWESMKGSNALSLNAGVSLLQSYGHDIGGFEGPQPSPELLLRWVQQGIYTPRFAINCFKTSPTDNLTGDVIEPWMYPAITPLVRAAIKRRYELLPYLYSFALESYRNAVPPQRWVGWGYEMDPEVWKPLLLTGETQHWLGDGLLVGGVYEPGATEARIYLPSFRPLTPHSTSISGTSTNPDTAPEVPEGFINLNHPYQHLSAGQWTNIVSPWRSSIPVLAKIGAVIPVGKSCPTASTSCHLEPRDEFPSLVADDYRGVEIFPPRGSSNGYLWKGWWWEDDGLSAGGQDEMVRFWVRYGCTSEDEEEGRVDVVFGKETTDNGGSESGEYVAAWEMEGLEVILPVGDERVVVYATGLDGERQEKEVIDRGRDRQGRRVFKIVG